MRSQPRYDISVLLRDVDLKGSPHFKFNHFSDKLIFFGLKEVDLAFNQGTTFGWVSWKRGFANRLLFKVVKILKVLENYRGVKGVIRNWDPEYQHTHLSQPHSR